MACSSGTYVRTLAEDIGEALGCGAHLTRLIRTAIGSFRLEQAHQFEHLESRTPEQRAGMPLPVDVLVRDLPDVRLSDPEETAFTHGRSIDLAGTAPGRIRVYGQGGRFLGLGQGDEAGRLIPTRLLAAA
jgi:tRNA pseudouridine55 synthase